MAGPAPGQQAVVANVQLPNGQIGQIISSDPHQAVWPGNAISLGN